MPDPTIPSFLINTDNAIHITIPNTDASIYDQGYTYNQPGFTYNQPGITYGGLINQNTDALPAFLTANLIKPNTITIPQTEAFITEQGYTYNQVGFSYNQAGVTYGGLTNQSWDVVPIILRADSVTPHPFAISDQSPTINVRYVNRPVGPGWFMFITYPIKVN